MKLVEQPQSHKQRVSACGFAGSRTRFSSDSKILYVQGRIIDRTAFLGPKLGPLKKQDGGKDVITKGINSAHAILERERFVFAQKHTASQEPMSPDPVHSSSFPQYAAPPLGSMTMETTRRDPSDISWKEVYWRTIILDTDDTGNIAGPEFGKCLDDWQEEIRHLEWEKSRTTESEQCPFDHSFKQRSFAWSLAANEAGSYMRSTFSTKRGYMGLGKPPGRGRRRDMPPLW